MKTDPPTKNNTPGTLADRIGALNSRINWLADVAEHIDAEVVGVDENERAQALPPKWPGAYIWNAPEGLKLGVRNTTLNKEWHNKWLWEVQVRTNRSALLQALLEMYSKVLVEVEVLLGQELQVNYPEIPEAQIQVPAPY